MIYGQIQVSGFEFSLFTENSGLSKDSIFRRSVEEYGIEKMQHFALKQGVLKTKDFFQGIILKGVDTTFNNDFYKQSKFEGLPLSGAKNEVLLSKILLKQLKLNIGESVMIIFPGKNIRRRKLKIMGVFSTEFHTFDKYNAFSSMELVQDLNNWGDEKIGGIEVFLKEGIDSEKANDNIYMSLGNNYISKTIRDLFPELYYWLETLNMNTYIIVTLMTIISVVSVISFLLILVLDRMEMVGILKVLGINNHSVSLLFLFLTTKIVFKGLLIGNVIAFGIIFLLNTLKIIPLDSTVYFIDYLPAKFDLISFLLIDGLMLLASVLSLIFPASIITRVSPSKVLRFQ